MNAGAEYVLYRVWSTLQDSRGIHPESLFTCLGALAGYACQAYVRHAGARGGADAGRYILTSAAASDGSVYLHGAALNLPLTESPLSIWALVGRAVQKAGRPRPDIVDILAHVTHTIGTGAFGLPRVSEQHRPRQMALFYLQQLWPQILPIAQRFCRRPAQLPMLFGIALQRAIEHTTELLDPALSATIAMECAAAMSRVALPGAAMDIIPPASAAPAKVLSPKPALNAEATASRFSRAPGTRVFATIASFAIIEIGSTMWRTERHDAPTVAPHIERKLRVSAFQRVSARC
jgi:hypothetical protein